MCFEQNLQGVQDVSVSNQPFWADNWQVNMDGFVADVKEGNLPGFSLVQDAEYYTWLKEIADKIKGKYREVLVLGMGGSSLGGKMLVDYCKTSHPLPVNFNFIFNVDPARLDLLMRRLPLNDTLVISISKSGGTIETLMQTALFIQAFERLGLEVNEHVIGISEKGNRPLRDMLEGYGAEVLEHDPKVGGRFSVMSIVGILPALIAGVDVDKLRQGAEQELNKFLNNPLESEAFKGASLAVNAQHQGLSNHVIMPYGDKLRCMPDWYVQLWAESLGKNGKGSMPVKAVGSTSQHSALQLFLDGPQNVLTTFILPTTEGEGTAVSEKMAAKMGDPIFAGLTAGTLIQAQGQGTLDSMLAAKRPVRVFETEELTENVLGALIMHFMLETVCAAQIWGIDAFDQPAVEDGKKRTLAYLQG